MTKRILRTFAVLTVFSLPTLSCTSYNSGKPVRTQDYMQTIRVACIGDSITYGASISNRMRNCYPAQLGRMLGDRWLVRNFGVGGATLLKNGDKPYWKQRAFKEALAFNPNVVVIKLGTNDTKPQNWKYKNEFVSDYSDMIDRFAALPARPRIWICKPVPAYPERWGISDACIKGEVIPLVAEVARKKHVGLIDLYKPLSGKPELFPDLIHPNAQGAELMAKEICRVLTGAQAAGEFVERGLPKVLIIGDSISIGYFKPLQELLKGKAVVEHNAGNAAHTANGLAHLDEWLGDTRWDVIHFNHGLHDLKYIDENGRNVDAEQGHQQIPIDQYENNLDEIVRRLQKTGARLIFATTTPVPDGTGFRVMGDSKKYNEVAVGVMNKYGVPVDDLYSFAMPQLDKIQRPRNVHFTEEG